MLIVFFFSLLSEKQENSIEENLVKSNSYLGKNYQSRNEGRLFEIVKYILVKNR
jgi:hypothetical protein